MHAGLQPGDEQALARALAACRDSRAESSTEIGPALRELRRVVDTLTLDAVRHARERRGNSWPRAAPALG